MVMINRPSGTLWSLKKGGDRNKGRIQKCKMCCHCITRGIETAPEDWCEVFVLV